MVKIFDTLSGKKTPFKPYRGRNVNLFVCGPTVYDFSHLGHARTYIAFDIIVKYLRQKGYEVFYLQNITDIDDKIIARAKEKGEKPLAFAKKLQREHFKDMESLGVTSVTLYAPATQYIPEIISQVERLLEKGYAYVIKDDGVYYDVSKFANYGKLAHRTVQQAEDGVSRIDESVNKRSKGDFALWKFSRPDEPKWKSPWGQGRPGWHIEDTAITEKYFGVQYDAHGGGRDLLFPHHEAEVAQMEAISGKRPLVNYWMHTGFLTVNGEKMSKSLGNFITIRKFLEGNPARLLRYIAAKAHYRSPIDYGDSGVKLAEKELNRIDEFIGKLKSPMPSRQAADFGKRAKLVKVLVGEIRKKFQAAMDDDFNTPQAVAALFELLKEGNILLAESKVSTSDSEMMLALLREIDEVFGFLFETPKKEKVPVAILALLKLREKSRAAKEWAKADEIRNELRVKGWEVEDTPSGQKLKLIRR